MPIYSIQPLRQVLLQIPSPLIFLRHGATLWNEQGRYQGIEDIPLTDAGREDARENADLIKTLIANGILDVEKLTVVTSPLLRARETAGSIASQLDLKVPIVNPAFREASIGRWQGLTSQQVKDRFYEERKRRKSDRWHFKPERGESMHERSLVISKALPILKPCTIVIAHCVILRIVLSILGNRPREEAAQQSIPHVGLLYWDGETLKNIPQITQ